jgi:hypothetical protein
MQKSVYNAKKELRYTQLNLYNSKKELQYT